MEDEDGQEPRECGRRSRRRGGRRLTCYEFDDGAAAQAARPGGAGWEERTWDTNTQKLTCKKN